MNDFRFGNEHVKTKVFMMMPRGAPVLDVDVEDYMWKEPDEEDRWIVEEVRYGLKSSRSTGPRTNMSCGGSSQNFYVLTSFGMFVGNVWIYVKSSVRQRAGALPEQLGRECLRIPVGGVKLFRYPTANDPCILVRTPDRNLVAYSQKCTHLSCAVYYSPGTESAGMSVPRGLLLD